MKYWKESELSVQTKIKCTFIYSRCFDSVTFEKKHSDDRTQTLYKIIFRDFQRSTGNYAHGRAFGEL